MQVSTDLHVWLSKKHNKAFDPDIIDISKAKYYINIKIHSLELRLWILLI
jgi:hypothetical protein